MGAHINPDGTQVGTPVSTSTIPCRYFLIGTCTRMDGSCRFSHEAPVASTEPAPAPTAAAATAPAAPPVEEKASAEKVVDWNAEKVARKCAAIEVDPDLDIAALRLKAQGNAMTDEQKKERGLLYDTSRASAVREESQDED